MKKIPQSCRATAVIDGVAALAAVALIIVASTSDAVRDMSPSPGFLSDLAAFEAMAIALAVPLSLDIVSRVSERYNSEVISKQFMREWEIGLLPPLLILNILVVVVLRFLVHDESVSSGWWRVVAWVTLVSFFLVAWVLLRFVTKLKEYMSNTESTLNKLCDDAETLLSERRGNLGTGQRRFIQTLEGIGDILVSETERRNRNKMVLHGLERIKGIVGLFFAIQEDDPDRFERLLLTQDILDIYGKDADHAKLVLALDPERYLVSFSTVVNQLTRIHEAALEARNNEISRFATYHLNWLLGHLSRKPKNELLVEQLLRRLAEVTRRALESQDSSVYAASVHWYIDIVFNRLGKDGRFDLSYLELFDRHFFATARYIVSENQTGLFHNLVSSLVDGVLIDSHGTTDVWQYGHLLLKSGTSGFQKYQQLNTEHDLERQIKELAMTESDLDTRAKLNEWLSRFEQLKGIVEPNLEPERRSEAAGIEIGIRKSVDERFKHNNLLRLVFAICTYCLFKRRPEYIRYLWDFKQPQDSDGTWIGHDIVPGTATEAVTLFFKKGVSERQFDFWEGHHGSELYYKQYFLLLLARALRSVKPTADGKHDEIVDFRLPDLNVHQLSSLEGSIDGLLKVAADLRAQTDIMGALGFDVLETGPLFDQKLLPFLDGLKLKAGERIRALLRDQKISQKKVGEFKNEVVESFQRSAGLRGIFEHCKLLEDRSNETYEGTVPVFGIHQVDEKASFFDEWHVLYPDWGSGYGRALASAESSHLLGQIAGQCEGIAAGRFDEILSTFDDASDLIIIADGNWLHRFLVRSEKFKPKWRPDIPKLEVVGFEGWYSLGSHEVPIFGAWQGVTKGQMLILRRSTMGRLIQHSPLSKGDGDELRTDIFCMRIDSLSENKALADGLIQNPPDWLKAVGDEKKQREHLQERVLIAIVERFEYSKDQKFKGYRLNLKE